MKDILAFLNANEGALMVIITAIYVLATILICRANIISARASRAQLDEMRKQYEENNRPRIEVELIYERRLFYIVRFTNHGSLIAQNVKIQISQAFIDGLPNVTSRKLLEKQKDKECIIGVGQHYDLYIGGNELRENPNMVPLTGIITYQTNGKTFSTDVYRFGKLYDIFFFYQ